MLRAMSPAEALAATDAMLWLGSSIPLNPARLVDSGLVPAGASPPAAPVNPIFAAALEAQSFCQAQSWRFCFIGAIPSSGGGEPRLPGTSI